ncbi:hypothetical protein BHU72_02000 [Desulfuribacillus stibiiarsenatis]|uniref:Molybdopterin cofactor biosynthesis MoaD-related C-terminal domain-containing protein n=1 Tax=Desulfuribacillus stibiiarsenatis TaxID=1390249 RepID=A0A1E5L659_9FIRM|nr:hypothetical protein [Desulfuribacillus stibiiarsenatis]OEH85596.1 hypothetical protein BHU72_02000 [Desulfuribacillus stibiiarsenatis]
MFEYESKHEMRGMQRCDLVNYFIEIGGHAIAANEYRGQDGEDQEWKVVVNPQESIVMGALVLPVTVLHIYTKSSVHHSIFVERFRKKFLSAGG